MFEWHLGWFQSWSCCLFIHSIHMHSANWLCGLGLPPNQPGLLLPTWGPELVSMVPSSLPLLTNAAVRKEAALEGLVHLGSNMED